MAVVIPIEGSQALSLALIASLPGGIYLAALTDRSDTTTLANMAEVTAVTGTYSRINCPQLNMTVVAGQFTCSGNFEFTGFTAAVPIRYIGLVTVASGTSGALIAILELGHKTRLMSDTGDILRVSNPSFRFT